MMMMMHTTTASRPLPPSSTSGQYNPQHYDQSIATTSPAPPPPPPIDAIVACNKQLRSARQIHFSSPSSSLPYGGGPIPPFSSICRQITVVNLHMNHLANLEGLQDCVNLLRLDVSSNKLTKMDSTLLSFPKLQELNLSGNNLTTIENVSRLRELRKLSLAFNNISSLKGLAQLPITSSSSLMTAGGGGRYSSAPSSRLNTPTRRGSGSSSRMASSSSVVVAHAPRLEYLDIRCNQIGITELQSHLLALHRRKVRRDSTGTSKSADGLPRSSAQHLQGHLQIEGRSALHNNAAGTSSDAGDDHHSSHPTPSTVSAAPRSRADSPATRARLELHALAILSPLKPLLNLIELHVSAANVGVEGTPSFSIAGNHNVSYDGHGGGAHQQQQENPIVEALGSRDALLSALAKVSPQLHSVDGGSIGYEVTGPSPLPSSAFGHPNLNDEQFLMHHHVPQHGAQGDGLHVGDSNNHSGSASHNNNAMLVTSSFSTTAEDGSFLSSDALRRRIDDRLRALEHEYDAYVTTAAATDNSDNATTKGALETTITHHSLLADSQPQQRVSATAATTPIKVRSSRSSSSVLPKVCERRRSRTAAIVVRGSNSRSSSSNGFNSQTTSADTSAVSDSTLEEVDPCKVKSEQKLASHQQQQRRGQRPPSINAAHHHTSSSSNRPRHADASTFTEATASTQTSPIKNVDDHRPSGVAAVAKSPSPLPPPHAPAPPLQNGGEGSLHALASDDSVGSPTSQQPTVIRIDSEGPDRVSHQRRDSVGVTDGGGGRSVGPSISASHPSSSPSSDRDAIHKQYARQGGTSHSAPQPIQQAKQTDHDTFTASPHTNSFTDVLAKEASALRNELSLRDNQWAMRFEAFRGEELKQRDAVLGMARQQWAEEHRHQLHTVKVDTAKAVSQSVRRKLEVEKELAVERAIAAEREEHKRVMGEYKAKKTIQFNVLQKEVERLLKQCAAMGSEFQCVGARHQQELSEVRQRAEENARNEHQKEMNNALLEQSEALQREYQSTLTSRIEAEVHRLANTHHLQLAALRRELDAHHEQHLSSTLQYRERQWADLSDFVEKVSAQKFMMAMDAMKELSEIQTSMYAELVAANDDYDMNNMSRRQCTTSDTQTVVCVSAVCDAHEAVDFVQRKHLNALTARNDELERAVANKEGEVATLREELVLALKGGGGGKMGEGEGAPLLLAPSSAAMTPPLAITQRPVDDAVGASSFTVANSNNHPNEQQQLLAIVEQHLRTITNLKSSLDAKDTQLTEIEDEARAKIDQKRDQIRHLEDLLEMSRDKNALLDEKVNALKSTVEHLEAAKNDASRAEEIVTKRLESSFAEKFHSQMEAEVAKVDAQVRKHYETQMAQSVEAMQTSLSAEMQTKLDAYKSSFGASLSSQFAQEKEQLLGVVDALRSQLQSVHDDSVTKNGEISYLRGTVLPELRDHILTLTAEVDRYKGLERSARERSQRQERALQGVLQEMSSAGP